MSLRWLNYRVENAFQSGLGSRTYISQPADFGTARQPMESTDSAHLDWSSWYAAHIWCKRVKGS